VEEPAAAAIPVAAHGRELSDRVGGALTQLVDSVFGRGAGMSAEAASTSSISVTYTLSFVSENLGFSSADTGFSTVSSALISAVSSGTFLTNLKSAGSQLGATDFKSITATTIVVVSYTTTSQRTRKPSHSPTSTPKEWLYTLPSMGYVWFPIAIAVGGMLCIAAIVMGIIVPMYQRKKDKYAAFQAPDAM
jgi:hypothetical protein